MKIVTEVLQNTCNEFPKVFLKTKLHVHTHVHVHVHVYIHVHVHATCTCAMCCHTWPVQVASLYGTEEKPGVGSRAGGTSDGHQHHQEVTA